MAIVDLSGGRVGFFGGVAVSTGLPIAQTLVYDSRSDHWATASPIPESRYGEAVARLDDGEVLFAGGLGNEQGNLLTLRTSYLYDATRDTWRRVGDLNAARANAVPVVLSDGKVLIVGGSDDQSFTELFDPATRLWSRAGPTVRPRTGEVLAPLPGGRAIAAGGCEGAGVYGQTPTSVETAEVFDEANGTWHPTRSMPEGKCSASGIPLPDGRVVVLGGFAVFGESVDRASVFDPASGTWTSAGSISTSGIAYTGQPLPIAILADHRVFVPMAGVSPAPSPVGRLSTIVVGGQLYDPASGTSSYVTSTDAVTSNRFSSPRVVGAAAADGKALVLLENNALIFDPSASPPATAVIDSTRLTTLLLAITAVLLVLIAIVYVAGRRPT